MMVQNNSGASDVGCLMLVPVSDSPESNVLLTARSKSCVVNRTKLQLLDMEVRGLASPDFRLLASVDS